MAKLLAHALVGLTLSLFSVTGLTLAESFTTQKANTTYSNSSYTYDGTGNLTNISDSVDGARNRTLGYDDLNRLTSAAGSWGSGSVSYDGGGNIRSQSFGAYNLNYNYDANNRLASVTGSAAGTYGYDPLGNITTNSGNSFTYINRATNRVAATISSVSRTY